MASTAELSLVIGVVDKASSGLSKISGGLGTLGKVAGGLALGGLTVAAAGVGALGAALVGGIGDAREAAIVFAQTESVIKSTGGAAGVSAEHVSDYAASLSAASGQSLFGDDQIQQSTNMLLTFKEIKGATLDAATAISVDMAQALGGAPVDASVALGKALNDPVQGISALSRMGVTFSEEQKGMIATMVETGDVAGAQAIILAELNTEFGGSAAAAAEADGGMTQFKDSMGELAETVGAQLLPYLNDFMTWLNSPEVMAGIESIVKGVMEGLGKAFKWLGDVAMPALKDAFIVAWPIIRDAVKTVYDFLATVVWPWLRDVAFPWIVNVGLPAIRDAFNTVWPIIQDAVKTVYNFLKDVVWPWLRDVAFPWIVNTGLPAIRDAFNTVWPIISDAVKTVYNFFKNTVWPWLETNIPKVGDYIEGVKTRWNNAWLAISGAVETAKNTISGIISTIKGLINGAITAINNLITAINSIPGVNLPTIPGVGGGGGSGFGGKSVGGFTPLGGIGGHPGGSVMTTINIDARGATSSPGQLKQAVAGALREAGGRADARVRIG